MTTVTYRFEKVATRRTRRGTCPTCGNNVTRSRTFENTINPFNRNADGTIRTRQEVWEKVNAEADEWVPDFRHNTDTCMSGDA